MITYASNSKKLALISCLVALTLALAVLTSGCSGCSGVEVAGTYLSPFSETTYLVLRADCTWSLHDREGDLYGKYQLDGSQIKLMASNDPSDFAAGTVGGGVLNITGVGSFYRR